MKDSADPADGNVSEQVRRLDRLLSDFVDRLRADGYALSYEALTEATGIFFDEIYRSPGDLSNLKYRLTPLFATCKADQQDLHRRIDELAVDAAPQTSLERRLERNAAERNLRYALFILPLVMITGLLVLLQFFFAEPDAPIPEPPAARQIEAPSVEELATDAPRIPLVPGVETLPQTILISYEEIPKPQNIYIIAGVIVLPLYFAFLWWLFRTVDRRRWMRRASYEPDAPGIVSNNLAQEGLPINNTLANTAGKMSGVQGGLSGRMNVRETVLATAKSAGFLSVVEDRKGDAADYVVLIEKCSEGDHLARIADVMLDRVEEAGVSIRRFFYRDDPRFSAPAGSERYSTSFRELAEQFGCHRFLMIGAADGLFNPVDGRFIRWPEAEHALLSKVLLASRRQAEWGYQEDELVRQGFLLAEASPAGLAAYGDTVSAQQEHAPRKLRSAYTARRPELDAYHHADDETEILSAKAYRERAKAEFRKAIATTSLDGLYHGGSRVLTLGFLALFVRYVFAAMWAPFVVFARNARSSVKRAREAAANLRAHPGAAAAGFVRGVSRNSRILLPSLVVLVLGFLLAFRVADALIDRSVRQITERVEQTSDPEKLADLSTFQECPECPVMVVIPAGEFLMGSPEDEVGRWPDESPQHKVHLSRFAIARTEVTFDQWKACVDDGGCTSNSSPSDEGWGRNDRPVINVNWTDAQEYVDWLNEKVQGDDPYRLPSEAEWEYAARATNIRADGDTGEFVEIDPPEISETAYFWGDFANHDWMNYGSDNCCSGLAEGDDRWEIHRSCRSVPGERIWLVRSVWQRVGMGGGLLA